jgi:hypothetical protein
MIESVELIDFIIRTIRKSRANCASWVQNGVQWLPHLPELRTLGTLLQVLPLFDGPQLSAVLLPPRLCGQRWSM